MGASLQLGRYAGIKVQIHWTFWLLFIFVAVMVFAGDGGLDDLFWYLLFVCALFFCVILHEFGHALTAKKYGVKTRSITLLPIGGVASLEELPDEPKEEFFIAIAGPLVNVVLAFLLYLIVPLDEFLSQDPEALEEQLATITAGNFLFYLLMMNIALVLFNMLPAFPMDGGRIFRALLSMKFGRIQATKVASGLGKLMALIFFVFGLFYSVILAVIAVFIYFGAHSENILIQQLSLLEGNSVRDAMITEYSILKPDATLSSAIDKILASTEQNFVVAEKGNVQGVLFMEDLASALKSRGKEIKISEVMDTDITLLKATDPLTQGYRQLQRGRKNFFPVMDNGEIVGVLDMNNINEFLTFRAGQDY